MQGLVIKSTGSWYTVLGEDKKKYDCRIKGKFRIKDVVSTNPIAVGDVVTFELEPEQKTAIITHLKPRSNYIIRKSVNLSKQIQIIAANIDQACLVITLASPRTSLGFIDRFLVSAEAYGIKAVLIFNKLDLFSDEGKEILADVMAIYHRIGYECFTVSALQGTHLTQITHLLKNKTSLFSGHSGVGKSSLINKIIPDINLKTGQISEWSDNGKHTTTFAEMFDLPFGGKLIDTPGIRELGVIDIEKPELGHFFPEMRERMNLCKYKNCVHVNEPHCAIIAAVENGEIELSRYDSYLSIYHGNDNRT